MIRRNTTASENSELLIQSCNHLVSGGLCRYEDILDRVGRYKTRERFVEELKKVIQEKTGCDAMPNSSMESVNVVGPSRSYENLPS